MIIRGYRSGDLRDLYRICLETGDSGDDATPLFRDPDLLGHIFAAPYGVLEPALAFVAEDQAGVGGYCLGALDTRVFEQRTEAEWWPSLRLRYPDPDPADRERWTPDEVAARTIHHPWLIDEELLASHPSHLHIDLLPRLQGGGNGRRLMEIQLAALRDRGSAGAHWHVSAENQRAVGFYRHLGFSELHADSTRHIFGVKLQPESHP
jgi:ribosomal protein S18 acetylase RimI-like enzyme